MGAGRVGIAVLQRESRDFDLRGAGWQRDHVGIDLKRRSGATVATLRKTLLRSSRFLYAVITIFPLALR